MTATDSAVRHPRAAGHLAHVPSLRVSPPPLRTAAGRNLEPRRVSWVELFFDLVFAGAVDQLAGTLQDHPDLGTLARFAFFFVPVWWLWVQFSFYADRHESDDFSHRGPFLVAIVLCAGLAASASRAVSGDPAGFVVAFAALRGLQLLLYARARRHLPSTRRLYGRYLICFGLGGSLWLASLPAAARCGLPSGPPPWSATRSAAWACSHPRGMSRSTPGTCPNASSCSC